MNITNLLETPLHKEIAILGTPNKMGHIYILRQGSKRNYNALENTQIKVAFNIQNTMKYTEAPYTTR
jgi:hypothetical protein